MQSPDSNQDAIGKSRAEDSGSVPAPRAARYPWLPELIVVALLMSLTASVFWATDLDMKVARACYDPAAPKGPWPLNETKLARSLYDIPASLAVGLIVSGVWAIVAGRKRRNARFVKSCGILILLSLLIGPGLLCNRGKRAWNHPRPKHLREFGGEKEYVRPLVIGVDDEEGKSFPSGHASAGFVYCVFWFVFRRRRRWLGLFFLGLSIVLGLAMGFLRIAGGAHFLSDVLLTFYVCYLANYALYNFVVRIPQKEDMEAAPVSP
jgi:lipid A 4'-phosphatase